MSNLRLARRLALFAGLLDVASGLLFVFFPDRFLPAVFHTTPTDLTRPWISFVGIFVLALGAVYLHAGARAKPDELRSALALTIPFRALVGLFVAVGVGLGHFAPPWIVVPVADFGLAAIQILLLSRPWN